jgi:cytosine permease
MKQTLSWKQLASIEVGGAICLPVIMVGHILFNKYGFGSACLAILAGNLVLLVLAFLSARMSFESKLPTTDNAVHYLGIKGAKGFACALLFSKTCWFGLQLNMMVLSFESIFPELMPSHICECLFGLLIILVASFGIKGLSFLSSLSMPLLVGTMGYAAYAVSHQESLAETRPIALDGISIAIATGITAVIDMPTYFRYARSRLDGTVAVLVFLVLAVPLVEFLGVYLCLKNNGGTLIESLQRSDSLAWNIWVCAFFMLAGWTTNITNLYSAANCLGTLLPQCTERKRMAMIGSLGLVLAMLQILNYFTIVLQIIGIMVGSMGCTLLMRYLLNRLGYVFISTSRQQKRLLIVWGIGSLAGLISLSQMIVLTSIPLLDACLSAMLLTAFVTLLNKEGRHENIVLG